MKTEILDAFKILKYKSQGLEETFINIDNLHLSKEDEDYAKDACIEIINAINLIVGYQNQE